MYFLMFAKNLMRVFGTSKEISITSTESHLKPGMDQLGLDGDA